MDHRRIMDILNANPMHIDSMLQLSEICKMGEDSATAAELIGQCTLSTRAGELEPVGAALFWGEPEPDWKKKSGSGSS